MQKPYAPKCGQGKTKMDLFRGFFTKKKSPMSKLRILFQFCNISSVIWLILWFMPNTLLKVLNILRF
jgi:hypothetical protein